MYYYKDECFVQHRDVSFSQYKYKNRTYEHKHDFFEIAYVIDGEGVHYIDDKCTKIKKGDYMILDTCISHYYEGTLEIANVIFHSCLIDEAYRNVKKIDEIYSLITMNSGYQLTLTDPVYHIFKDDGNILKKFLYIKNEIENKGLGYIDCTRAFLISIIMQSLRNICTEELAENNNCPVRFIEKYIHEHYSEDVNLSQLSENLGFSVSYMSKRFKALTGSSFSDYLKRTRIQVAASILMKNPHMSIEDLAESVGYSDLKYFTTLFKKYMGKTPVVFKRLYLCNFK